MVLPVLGSPGGLIAAGSLGSKISGFAKGLGSALSIFGSVKDLFGGNNHAGKLQRLREDTQLQRLVADAKAAGIHPLYALGSSANYAPTSFVGGGPDYAAAGEAITRTVDRYSAEAQAKRNAGLETALAHAQLAALGAQARRDEASAALSNAEAAKARQSLNWSPVGRGGLNATYDPLYGLFEETPASVVAPRPGQPGVQAGPAAPGSQEVVWPDGTVGTAPPQQLMDSELPGVEWYVRKYGSALGRAVAKAQLAIQDRWRRYRRMVRQRNAARRRKGVL